MEELIDKHVKKNLIFFCVGRKEERVKAVMEKMSC